jgi:1,4-alpha-glucan branching enzyme
MGNEFGHPEWIDFPREGNNWSYRYARRQWNLVDNKDLKFRYLAAFDRKMVSLQNEYHFMDRGEISRVYENSNDKVIAYTRANLLFVFNFHSNKSYTDYGIQVKGKFKVVLDSDDDEFGGFNRIDRSIEYTSVSKIERRTQGAPFKLNLYLPARTAIVFRAIPIRRATDS